VIPYQVVSESELSERLSPLPEAEQQRVRAELGAVSERSTQRALGKMAIFPGIMVAAYVGLIIYFRAKGGYKPKVIGEHETGDADLPAATR
jgi:hypothetical protein